METWRRFPLVLIAAVVSFGAAFCLIEDLGPEGIQLRLMAAASLGLALFTALTLFAERRRLAPLPRAGVFAAGFALLAAYYLLWPGWTETMRGIRYAQLSVAFHLLAALLPPDPAEGQDGFWEYNRRIFLRILGSVISSGTLYLGLTLALLAIHTLFDVDIANEGYVRLWAFTAFVFNTWFFLGGVPRVDQPLERGPYPQPLRVFAQFTLVPLVSIYLVILTLYLGKVLITWDWPRGWIGWLVSGVAAAGILALLLVHPLAEREDQTWIRVFARNFWLAVMPAVAMLWLAIYQRVHQYGVTEPRYFLIILSVWLAGLAVYYTLTRSRNIRIIPVSLCILALVTFAGPWSAYRVSARDQVGRLRALLAATGGSRPAATPSALAFARSRQVSAIIRYVLEQHGPGPLLAMLPDSLRRRVAEQAPGEQRVRLVAEGLGAEYVTPWRNTPVRETDFSFSSVMPLALPIGGYDLLLRIESSIDTARADTGVRAGLSADHASVEVRSGRRLLVRVPLDSMVGALPAADNPMRFGTRLPAARLSAAAESAGTRAVVYLESVGGNEVRGIRRVTGVSGLALLRTR